MDGTRTDFNVVSQSGNPSLKMTRTEADQLSDASTACPPSVAGMHASLSSAGVDPRRPEAAVRPSNSKWFRWPSLKFVRSKHERDMAFPMYDGEAMDAMMEGACGELA